MRKSAANASEPTRAPVFIDTKDERSWLTGVEQSRNELFEKDNFRIPKTAQRPCVTDSIRRDILNDWTRPYP